MSIRVFLRDRLNDSGGVWAKALGPAPGAELVSLCDPFYRNASCDPDNESANATAADALILLHHSDNLSTWHQHVSGAQPVLRGHLVVISNPGRVVIPQQFHHERIHACAYTPEDFYQKSQPQRLQAWIHQIRKGEIENVTWTLLHPAPTERLWALRLLCEAFFETRTKPNVERVNWLLLLGEDDEPPAISPDEVIKKIRADYDDLSPKGSTAISTFLDSLKNGAPKSKDDVRDCLNKLNSLLGVSAAATTD
jgi:hypothetical protein